MAETGWVVVELGDGQVAGLPWRADPEAFYRSLLENWPPVDAVAIAAVGGERGLSW